MSDKLTQILIREKIKEIKFKQETNNRHIKDHEDFLTKATSLDDRWEADYVRKNLESELQYKILIEEYIQLYSQIFNDNGYNFDEYWKKYDVKEELENLDNKENGNN